VKLDGVSIMWKMGCFQGLGLSRVIAMNIIMLSLRGREMHFLPSVKGGKGLRQLVITWALMNMLL